MPTVNTLTSLKQVVDWIDKEILEHSISFPEGRTLFVNGAMTALKNLKHFIDLSETAPPEEPDQEVLWDQFFDDLDGSLDWDSQTGPYILSKAEERIRGAYTLTRK